MSTNHTITVQSSYSESKQELHVWYDDGTHTVAKDSDHNTGLNAIGWEYSRRTVSGGPLWRVQWHFGTASTFPAVSLQWVQARIRDPVTVYVGVGASRDMAALHHTGPRRAMQWTAQTGVVYAVTHDVTLDGRVSMSWRGDDRLADMPLPGTRQHVSQLSLGAAYAPTAHTMVTVHFMQRLDQPGHTQLQFGFRLQGD